MSASRISLLLPVICILTLSTIDEDLAAMYLSDKKNGHPRENDDHEELEVLLESFSKQVEEIVNEAENIQVSNLFDLRLLESRGAITGSSVGRGSRCSSNGVRASSPGFAHVPIWLSNCGTTPDHITQSSSPKAPWMHHGYIARRQSDLFTAFPPSDTPCGIGSLFVECLC